MVRRAATRQHQRRRAKESWLTFAPPTSSLTPRAGFDALDQLVEERCGPHSSTASARGPDAEVVTYVHSGSFTYRDDTGRAELVQTGEFHRMALCRGLRRSETNPSSQWTHLFRLWLRPSQIGLEPSAEHRRFSAAERSGALRLIASPDARDGSLRLHLDARLYSAVLSSGQHVVHELPSDRSAWLHVVAGEITLEGQILYTGDSAGLVAERVVSLTARGNAEILLLDLEHPHHLNSPEPRTEQETT